MSGLTKAQLLKRIRKAQERVQREIAGNAAGEGRFAAGLSNEGYAGGYRRAINDIEELLVHGYPSDVHGYWSEPSR